MSEGMGYGSCHCNRPENSLPCFPLSLLVDPRLPTSNIRDVLRVQRRGWFDVELCSAKRFSLRVGRRAGEQRDLQANVLTSASLGTFKDEEDTGRFLPTLLSLARQYECWSHFEHHCLSARVNCPSYPPTQDNARVDPQRKTPLQLFLDDSVANRLCNTYVSGW